VTLTVLHKIKIVITGFICIIAKHDLLSQKKMAFEM